MNAFSENEVNNYLASIANNQVELQNFANDLQNNFINAFETRFIMVPDSLASLQSWPQAAKDVIIQTALMTAQLHSVYNTDPVIMTVSGFEAPQGSSPQAAGSVEVGGSISTETDTTTGQTKVKATISAKWTIC